MAAAARWASLPWWIDLARGDSDLHRELAELAHALGHALAGLLPRASELLAVLLEIGLARVGELEDVAAVARFRTDEPLVGEELECRVDRAGARAPGALRPLLDLLHHLIAVARLLFEQEQDRGADVAAAHPPAAGTARAAKTAGPPKPRNLKNCGLNSWAAGAEGAGA